MSGASENRHQTLLKSTVHSLFNSELYSDIEVVLMNGEHLKCHKLVLSQSKVFAKAFDPMYKLKEAVDGVINLTNDQHEPTKAMLQYLLYTGDYSICDDSTGIKMFGLLWHVSMYTMGEIYALDSLKVLAMDRFAQDAIGSPDSPVTLHPCVLVSVIREIYESTLDSSRGMRDMAILAAENRGIGELLMDNWFKKMMDEVGSFGKDLLLRLHPLPPQELTRAYRCRSCHHTVERVVGRKIKVEPCPRCGLHGWLLCHT